MQSFFLKPFTLHHLAFDVMMKEANHLCNETIFPDSNDRRNKLENELRIDKNCKIQYITNKPPAQQYYTKAMNNTTFILIVMSLVFTLLVSVLLCVLFKRARIKRLWQRERDKEKCREIKLG